MSSHVALARPGDVIAGSTVLKRTGDVAAVTVDEAGGVFVAGVFGSVSGVEVPGLVRLLPDGSVDTEFVPGVGVTEGGEPVLGTSFLEMVGLCPTLIALPELGGVMIGDPGLPGGNFNLGWAMLDAGGNLDLDALPDLPRDAGVLPQFVEDDELVAIVKTEANGVSVRRYNLQTGLEDPAFQPSRSHREPRQVIRSGEGMVLLESSPRTAFVVSPADGGALPKSAIIGHEFGLRAIEGESGADSKPVEVVNGDAARLFDVPGNDSVAFLLEEDQPWEAWPEQPRSYKMELRHAVQDDDDGAEIDLDGTPPFLPLGDGAVVMSDPIGVGRPSDPEPLRRALWRQQDDGLSDPNFDRSTRAARTLTPLADGKILVDGQKRLLADGEPDPEWSVPELLASGKVDALWSGTGGGVFGAGEFSRVDGLERPGIARWLADGTLDLTFAPAPAEGEVIDIAPLPDGGAMVLRRLDGFGDVHRLRVDGSIDESFELERGLSLGFASVSDIGQIEALPDGGILASLVGEQIWIPLSRWVLRFEPSGDLEDSYEGRVGWDGDIAAIPDGGYFSGARRFLANDLMDTRFLPPTGVFGVPLGGSAQMGWLFASQEEGHVLLRDDDGSIDRSFDGSAIPDGSTVTADEAGFWYVFPPLGDGEVIRLYPDGRRDPSFRIAALERRNESIAEDLPLVGAARNGQPASAAAGLVHPLTGELWLAGDFSRIGSDLRSGLARLETSVPDSYAGWSSTIFPSQQGGGPDDDPDRDGLSNWREYAGGTQPLVADAAAGELRFEPGVTRSLDVPLNPAAADVEVEIEASNDLETWDSPSPGELQPRAGTRGLSFSLVTDGQLARHWRARYRQR